MVQPLSHGLEVLPYCKSTGKPNSQLNTDNAGLFQLCVQLVIPNNNKCEKTKLH